MWLAGCALLLAPTAAPAQSNCKSIGGAGDEYCESLPGAGGDRDAAPPKLTGGLREGTSRALERAGAGAVRQVESPARARPRPASASNAPDPGIGEDGGGSVLPYILAALTLTLVVAAVARYLRGTGSEGSAAA